MLYGRIFPNDKFRTPQRVVVAAFLLYRTLCFFAWFNYYVFYYRIGWYGTKVLRLFFFRIKWLVSYVYVYTYMKQNKWLCFCRAFFIEFFKFFAKFFVHQIAVQHREGTKLIVEQCVKSISVSLHLIYQFDDMFE